MSPVFQVSLGIPLDQAPFGNQIDWRIECIVEPEVDRPRKFLAVAVAFESCLVGGRQDPTHN